MNMKIIIKNRCEFIDESTAMEIVSKVINKGKISNGTYGKQYRFLTSFEYNTQKVYVGATKRKSGTHTFEIWH